jgi:hypothetical protein
MPLRCLQRALVVAAFGWSIGGEAHAQTAPPTTAPPAPPPAAPQAAPPSAPPAAPAAIPPGYMLVPITPASPDMRYDV